MEDSQEELEKLIEEELANVDLDNEEDETITKLNEITVPTEPTLLKPEVPLDAEIGSLVSERHDQFDAQLQECVALMADSDRRLAGLKTPVPAIAEGNLEISTEAQLQQKILLEIEAELSDEEEEDLEALELLTAQAKEDLQITLESSRKQVEAVWKHKNFAADNADNCNHNNGGATSLSKEIENSALKAESSVTENNGEIDRETPLVTRDENLQVVAKVKNAGDAQATGENQLLLHDDGTALEKMMKVLELTSRKDLAALKQKQKLLWDNVDKEHQKLAEIEMDVSEQVESARHRRAAELEQEEVQVRKESERKEKELAAEVDKARDEVSELSRQFEDQLYNMEKDSKHFQTKLQLEIDMLTERQKSRNEEAAIKIQALYRGFRARQEYGDAVQTAFTEAREDMYNEKVKAAQQKIEGKKREEQSKEEEKQLLEDEKRRAAEAEEKRKQEELEAKKRKIQEEKEAKRKHEEEKKRKKEEELRQRREEQEKKKQEEEKKKREEEEFKKQKAEETKRKKAEAALKKQKQEEEQLKKRAQEEADRKRKEEEIKEKEEAERKEKEENEKKAESEKQAVAELKCKKEEEPCLEEEPSLVKTGATIGATHQIAGSREPLMDSEHREATTPYDPSKYSSRNHTTIPIPDLESDMPSLSKTIHEHSLNSEISQSVRLRKSSDVRKLSKVRKSSEMRRSDVVRLSTAQTESSDVRNSVDIQSSTDTKKGRNKMSLEKALVAERQAREDQEKQDKIRQYKEWMEQRKHSNSQTIAKGKQEKQSEIRKSKNGVAVIDWSHHEAKLEERRKRWIQECTSWSEIEAELSTPAPKPPRHTSRRVTSAGSSKTHPPIPEHLVLAQSGAASLAEVETVKVADLPGCSISSLSVCRKLQSLILKRCGISKLEFNDPAATSLKFAHLTENSITSLFWTPPSLVYLNLSTNNLTSCRGLETCLNVKYLNLSHNKISKLGNSLSGLKMMQVLNLSHNDLISDKGVSQYPSLQELDFSYNHLTSAEEAGKLGLLRVLCLTGNNLTEIPRLHNCVLLNKLMVDDNSIAAIGSLAYCWLPCLTEVNIGMNNITSIQALNGVPSLRQLDLNSNQIVDINTICDGLQWATRLQGLQLAGNPVQAAKAEQNREKLFTRLPWLLSVDGISSTNQNRDSLQTEYVEMFEKSVKAFNDLQRQYKAVVGDNLVDYAKSNVELLQNLPKLAEYYVTSFELSKNIRYAHEYGELSFTTPDAHANIKDIRNSSARTTVSEVHVTGDQTSVINSKELFELRLREKLQTTELKVSQENLNIINEHISPRTPNNIKSAVVDDNTVIKSTSVVNKSLRKERAATKIQAMWRGYSLRKQLMHALASARLESQYSSEEELPEIDISKFECDLDDDWTISNVPQIPASHAVLPSKNYPAEYINPDQRQAWDSYGDSLGPITDLDLPLNVDNGRGEPGDLSTNRSMQSRREEQLANEWGFKDSGTVELMMKRAKKLKYNAQRKNKLKNLDPVSRYEATRKILEHDPPKVVMPVRKVVPKKEYFRALEDEARKQNWEVQKKHEASAERTYEWIHTQYDPEPEQRQAFADINYTNTRRASGSGLPYLDRRVLEGGKTQLVGSPLEIESVSSFTINSAGSRRTPSAFSHHSDFDAAQMDNHTANSKYPNAGSKTQKAPRDIPVQLLDEFGAWGSGKKRSKR